MGGYAEVRDTATSFAAGPVGLRLAMSAGVQAALAVAPILVAALLLIGFRVPARTAMPIVYVIAALIGGFIWRMPLAQLAAATVQGLFITFDILFIIFAAILLLNTLKHSGAVAAIRAAR